MADGGGLENRYGAEASSWVRIPRPPRNAARVRQHLDRMALCLRHRAPERVSTTDASAVGQPGGLVVRVMPDDDLDLSSRHSHHVFPRHGANGV